MSDTEKAAKTEQLKNEPCQTKPAERAGIWLERRESRRSSYSYSVNDIKENKLQEVPVLRKSTHETESLEAKNPTLTTEHQSSKVPHDFSMELALNGMTRSCYTKSS